jgi:catechol 2,3-dioxygenase-like lactoylglutathione lyase family enzyme
MSAGRQGSNSSPPFGLEGIDHVLLVVDGMERAIAFYENVLGCRLEERYPQWGMAQLRAGAALINLVDIAVENGAWARPEAAGGRNMDHLCMALGAHDEQALRDHLARHGVEVVEESWHASARGESLSIYVRDPSGNTLELKGPPARD